MQDGEEESKEESEDDRTCKKPQGVIKDSDEFYQTTHISPSRYDLQNSTWVHLPSPTGKRLCVVLRILARARPGSCIHTPRGSLVIRGSVTRPSGMIPRSGSDA
jgi:hypothetical protein